MVDTGPSSPPGGGRQCRGRHRETLLSIAWWGGTIAYCGDIGEALLHIVGIVGNTELLHIVGIVGKTELLHIVGIVLD